MDIQLWSSPFNINTHDNPEYFLLKKNNSDLENKIWEIVSFHLNENINEKYIYFGIRKMSFLPEPFCNSFSCVCFIENEDSPLIFTDITIERYKYKEFDNVSCAFVFPKIGEHVVYDSKKIISRFSLSGEPLYLFIHVCDERFYKSGFPTSTLSFVKSTFEKVDIEVVPSEIDSVFWEEFLYKKKIPDIQIQKNVVHRFENISRLLQDLERIRDIIPNRFSQRFHVKSFFTKEICKWFLKEQEKSDSVEQIPSLFQFMVYSSYLDQIVDKMKSMYGLNDQVKINILSLSFSNEISAGVVITCKIALSEMTISFNDGLIFKLDQGDLILYNSLSHVQSDDTLTAQINIMSDH